MNGEGQFNARKDGETDPRNCSGRYDFVVRVKANLGEVVPDCDIKREFPLDGTFAICHPNADLITVTRPQSQSIL